MITLAQKNHCTGCGACKAVCPNRAISFFPDDEGFPSPIIDTGACISCGFCEKSCPALHQPEQYTIKSSFAVQINDKEALKESTSGGVFTALSREVFKRGGVVYGCVWDNQYNAIIHKAENEEEIIPMRGSKYVWSWAGDTFSEIKDYLNEGRTVLFTGLPCQVAGLKNYLCKDYDSLFLVDFFCGGTPSPYAFHEYLKSISKDVPLDQLHFFFRDKAKHGVGVHISYNTTKGRKTQNYISNPYYYSFYSKLLLRRSCYHCQYRYAQRVADMTIGDYWGVAQFHQEFDIRAGVSALLINTDKGKELLDAVRADLLLADTDVQNIAKGNNLTLEDKVIEFDVPEFRNAFFKTLKTNGWVAAEYKYLYNKTRLKLWLKTKIPSKYVTVLKRLLGR